MQFSLSLYAEPTSKQDLDQNCCPQSAWNELVDHEIDQHYNLTVPSTYAHFSTGSASVYQWFKRWKNDCGMTICTGRCPKIGGASHVKNARICMHGDEYKSVFLEVRFSYRMRHCLPCNPLAKIEQFSE